MDGWICLHRRLLEWEWYTETNTLCLFLHLLLSANHKEKKWRGVTVKKGQLITGRKTLSIETGLSERNIRTALKNLQKTNEVTIKTTKHYSIISITNWQKYQSSDQQNDQQNDQKATNDRPAPDQHPTTNNNDNNDNNVTNNNTRGSRINADWVAPDEFVNYCEVNYPAVDAKEALAQFKDHWIAKAGKDGVKKDWLATWRNWLRNGYNLPMKSDKKSGFGTRKKWTGGV